MTEFINTVKIKIGYRSQSTMRHIYCPICGSQLVKKEIGDEGLIPYCNMCEKPIWDSFTTSIICAVVNEQQEIALIRQGYVSEHSFICVAGIMQMGESAEDTVIREVKEELGLDVVQLRYIQSYPYLKKEMLMLGFCAEVRKEAFQLSQEVDSANWFSFDEALSQIKEGSIAWQLVKTVIEKRTKVWNQENY